MENDRQFSLTSCPRDGSIWLEELFEYPATRWEPGGADVDEQPCPICGTETEPSYAFDGTYGQIAIAALEAVRCVAIAVEFLGLPVCSDCGHSMYEGMVIPSQGTAFCWACYDERIEKGLNQP